MRDDAAVGPAFAPKLWRGRQEIRRVGKDGIEPAVGIFGGDGVEQFEAVAVVETDERGVGGENQGRRRGRSADLRIGVLQG